MEGSWPMEKAGKATDNNKLFPEPGPKIISNFLIRSSINAMQTAVKWTGSWNPRSMNMPL